MYTNILLRAAVCFQFPPSIAWKEQLHQQNKTENYVRQIHKILTRYVQHLIQLLRSWVRKMEEKVSLHGCWGMFV